MEHNISLAMILTLLAGLSTGIGSAVVFFTKTANRKFLSFSLGFSAGIMLYISFMELLLTAKEYLQINTSHESIISFAAFFSGMWLILLIDTFIPSPESKLARLDADNTDIRRTGTLLSLAIAIHNFPEGLATFTSTLDNPPLGIAIAVAIAIHNIPEGIATSIPLYYATGNRKKSFLYSFLSGLTEPAGAIIGYLFLRPFLSDTLYGIIFAFIAGIMVYISVKELIPTACEYDKSNIMIFGVIAGMIVMYLSLAAI